jgi:hypothetical protein
MQLITESWTLVLLLLKVGLQKKSGESGEGDKTKARIE